MTAAGVLGGCSLTPAPKLDVVAVQPAARSADGLGLVFTLAAENPGEEPLPLRTVEYRLELDGRTVFEGTRSPEATIRRQGTQTITLPAVVRIADHPELQSGGAVPYRLSGILRYTAPGQIAEVLFDAGVSVPSVEFSDSGMVELMR